jgi:hypothetical protein
VAGLSDTRGDDRELDALPIAPARMGADDCCEPAELDSCCESSEKADCCGLATGVSTVAAPERCECRR